MPSLSALSGRVTHALVVENLRAMGFLRVLAGGRMMDLADPGAEDPETVGLDLTEASELLVVVDRLKVILRSGTGLPTRWVRHSPRERESPWWYSRRRRRGEHQEGFPQERLYFTEHFRCPRHPEREFPEPTPQLFSFNNPYGSCPVCTGFGATLEYDEDLIIPNPRRSIQEGAVDPWTKPRYFREQDRLRAFTQGSGRVPVRALGGASLRISGRWSSTAGAGFRGVIPFLRSREPKRYKRYIRVFLRQYQSPRPCRACGGARIRPEASAGQGGRSEHRRDLRRCPWRSSISGPSDWSWWRWRHASPSQSSESSGLVSFSGGGGPRVPDAGSPDPDPLGGEAQRINLANSLGSSLVDALYVLDEPTIGLHPRDTASPAPSSRLASRIVGNTVVVVEHDPMAIRAADHVVELGPGSGEKGGQVVYEGSTAGSGRGRYRHRDDTSPDAPPSRFPSGAGGWMGGA